MDLRYYSTIVSFPLGHPLIELYFKAPPLGARVGVSLEFLHYLIIVLKVFMAFGVTGVQVRFV